MGGHEGPLLFKGIFMEEMNSTAKSMKKTEPKLRQSLRYMRDKDAEKVRGIFHFNEVPGGSMSFMYKAYAEDEIERYDMLDGEIYTVPLGVARHLNKNCTYPVHRYETDEKGKATVKIGQKVSRCSFQSLEFIDIDEMQPDPGIITVEKVL